MTDSAGTPAPTGAPTSPPWLWPAVIAVVAVAAVAIAVVVSSGDDSDSAPATTTAATATTVGGSSEATDEEAPAGTTPATDSDGEAPACPEFTENLSLPLQLCDRGMAVRVMQENLTQVGFPVDADGFFGPATEAAVSAFQTDAALETDGIYGPDTSAAMDERLAAQVD